MPYGYVARIGLDLQSESARRGDAALFHRYRSQAGKADHVADGEDVGHLGAIVLVDGDPAAPIGFQTSCSQVQLIHVALAAHCV